MFLQQGLSCYFYRHCINYCKYPIHLAAAQFRFDPGPGRQCSLIVVYDNLTTKRMNQALWRYHKQWNFMETCLNVSHQC